MLKAVTGRCGQEGDRKVCGTISLATKWFRTPSLSAHLHSWRRRRTSHSRAMSKWNRPGKHPLSGTWKLLSPHELTGDVDDLRRRHQHPRWKHGWDCFADECSRFLRVLLLRDCKLPIHKIGTVVIQDARQRSSDPDKQAMPSRVGQDQKPRISSAYLLTQAPYMLFGPNTDRTNVVLLINGFVLIKKAPRCEMGCHSR